LASARGYDSGMFSLFKKGLVALSSRVSSAIAKLTDRPTAHSLEELEEVLLAADIGPEATAGIVAQLRQERLEGLSPADALRRQLRQRLQGIAAPLNMGEGIQTIFIVGINGAGKTTTVAKLAHQMKRAGRKPIIASADTFRAAANTQLATWAERAGVPLIESRTGADPAAVAYDALQAARSRGHDTLIIDSAGRLTTKETLMAELGKIDRVLKKIDPTAPQHRLLVLDGSLGLNSLAQAEAFTQVAQLTGVIVTKLDGSARAGFLIPLYAKLRLPVHYVGLGEGIEDLQPFDTEEYITAITQ
jgi:fused signal recognition particle receptor